MEKSSLSLPVSALTKSLLLICSFLLLLILFNRSAKEYAGGDARYALLTSQAILQHGRVHLNPYLADVDLDSQYGTNRWQLHRSPRTDAIYYIYPLGTSFACLPFVWVANRLGMDMAQPRHDEALQLAISAILACILLFVLYRIARFFLDDIPAVLAAMIFMCSTTILSTFGTALWSHNLMSLLIALAVLEMLKSEFPGRGKFNPWVFGFLLVAAWLTRPTAMAFDAGAIGWMVIRHRFKVWKPLAVMAGVFGLFVLFCLDQYQTWMHSYYLPSSWKHQEPMGSNLPELLVSPSRGLFTFTPILLFAFMGPVFPAIRKSFIWWTMLGGFCLHLALLSRHECWYAGWAYGPRFFSDVHSLLFVMLVFFLREFMNVQKQWLKHVAVITGFVLVSFGIFVHGWQGLYNSAPFSWNDVPGLTHEEDYIAWNWRYPQFMATAAEIQLKKKEYDLYRKYGMLAAESPEDAALLIRSGEIDANSAVRYWNRKHTFGSRRVFNTLSRLYRDKANEIYFFPEDRNAVAEDKSWKVVESPETIKLGEFVKMYASQYVFLTAQGDALSHLSESSRAMLMGQGLRIDTVKSGSSYICYLKQGKVEVEASDSLKPLLKEMELPNGVKVVAGSAGLTAGGYCFLNIKGMDFALHGIGMNVVVTDNEGHYITRRCFNLSERDLPDPHVLKAVRIASPPL